MALPAATGQLGTTQTTHVYLWGRFSLPGTPAGGSVPCLLGTTPFSPLGAPLPANSTTGWTPELSGGAWLRGGQGASPVPLTPCSLAHGPGAAFGLKSVYGHTWKEPNGWPPSGEIVRGAVPPEGASAERTTFASRPFPAAPQCRIK